LRSFHDWQPILEQRQFDYEELLAIPEHVEVEIASQSPILVGLFGDVHALHPEVNLRRFAQDIEDVKSVGGYFITLGDLTDSIHWGPVPGLTSDQEAMLYMQAAMDYMAEDGHLLAAWTGDHDMWAFDKHNSHTLYQDFWDKYHAHLLDGVSYIDIIVNDGTNEVRYGIVGSHRHKGFSVYNDSHASLRQWRDEGVGSVISITAHKHVKAHNRQVHKLHTGTEVLFHSIAAGTYKTSDRYMRKKGWPRKGQESIGAFGILLYPAQERIRVFWNTADAVECLSNIP
jgi:hypothetical protein